MGAFRSVPARDYGSFSSTTTTCATGPDFGDTWPRRTRPSTADSSRMNVLVCAGVSTSQKWLTPVRMVETAPISVEMTHGRVCYATTSASTPDPIVDT